MIAGYKYCWKYLVYSQQYSQLPHLFHVLAATESKIDTCPNKSPNVDVKYRGHEIIIIVLIQLMKCMTVQENILFDWLFRLSENFKLWMN